jgi:signal transduction histidine kinase
MIALQANVARIRAQRDEERKAFMDIEDSAKHAAALTRRLLRFSRKQAVDMKPLDVNAVVHDLAELLRRLLGQDVRVQLSLHPMPLVADADATMLDQLLMNLAVNARDAMPAGGWLIIETSALVVSAEDELARLAPGEYVCLRVSDCGCGIAKDDLARIFDPFFTTKGSEHGTGLGLATVRMIVEQHRGAIDVSSELGAGTSFRVLLPRG